MKNGLFAAAMAAVCALFVTGCGAWLAGLAGLTPTPTRARELVYCGWSDDKIAVVADAFQDEYGAKVTHRVYETQEEAIENIRAGYTCDVADIESQLIPQMLSDSLLAEIDYRNVPNFKNVPLSFRDLSYDPRNKHTIPYGWGTTGIVVRSDRVQRPLTRWADLWDVQYAGRVVFWEIPRYTLAVALKSLGYSANSEKRLELEAALDRLLQLKDSAIWISGDEETLAPQLVSGEAVMGYGWAYDVRTLREANVPVWYVLPEEGAVLWTDTLVIPANSPSKYTSELFLNFLLRPEISAKITNASNYPLANDAAKPLVEARLRDDSVVYPGDEQLKRVELLLPLTPEGQNLHDEIWQRFLDARHGESGSAE
jgi:spermidine/putrescine transport system substrate-binding protein